MLELQPSAELGSGVYPMVELHTRRFWLRLPCRLLSATQNEGWKSVRCFALGQQLVGWPTLCARPAGPPILYGRFRPCRENCPKVHTRNRTVRGSVQPHVPQRSSGQQKM